MSITDELREYAEDWDWVDTGAEKAQDRIEAIADRIDAKHEEAIASMMNDALYHANDKDMADLGWVKLPKDADGVPIRVGDVIKLPNGRSEEVRYMIINGAGWLINEAGWISCKVSHDKPDTWERIIEDAMGRYSDADADALVARCKALAGEDE